MSPAITAGQLKRLADQMACLNAARDIPTGELYRSIVEDQYNKARQEFQAAVDAALAAAEAPTAAQPSISPRDDYEAGDSFAGMADAQPAHASELGRFISLAEANGIKSIHDLPGLIPVLQATEPVQVWCDTCEGKGMLHQESQHGVIGSGGDFPCPDCAGKGFNVRAASPQPVPLTDEQHAEVLDALPKADERETVVCCITGSTLRALARAHGIGSKA